MGKILNKSSKLIKTGWDEKSRLSIAELKSEFESEGETFKDEELDKIRDFFYLLAQINYEQYQRTQQIQQPENCKIINIQNYQTDEPAKSNIVYPCEYGRTG